MLWNLFIFTPTISSGRLTQVSNSVSMRLILSCHIHLRARLSVFKKCFKVIMRIMRWLIALMRPILLYIPLSDLGLCIPELAWMLLSHLCAILPYITCMPQHTWIFSGGGAFWDYFLGLSFWEYDQNMLILCLLQAGKDRSSSHRQACRKFPATDKQTGR